MSAPIIQQIVDDAFTAQIAADQVIIAALQAQIANITPPEAPTQWNTGTRGSLTTGINTVANTTYSNKISSGSNGVTLPAASVNVTYKNCKITSTGTNGLNVTAAAGFVMTDSQVDKAVTGAGTFKSCNLASLALTGPSVVKNCYIPGGISGAGATDPATVLENNTVTP